MKKINLLLASVFLSSSAAFAGADPATLKINVLAVYASTSNLCTNPILVPVNPGFVNFLASPTLGGGDLADGTYNCIIIKMSSLIKYTPKDSTGGAPCVSTTEFTSGVCNLGQPAADSLSATGDITCLGDGSNTGSVDNTVFLYLSTGTNGTGNNAFKRPVTVGDTNGIKLGAPLVISSTSRAKFVVNGTGKISGGSGQCGMNAPTFTFVNL